MKEKLPFHLGKFPVDSPVFLIFARILPGYGSKFVSIVSGMNHVPMDTYICTSAVSNLFGASYLVLLGAGLIHLIK